MARTAADAQPHFSQPVQQIFAMVFVLALSLFGAVLALPRVLPVFQANPYLNGFILAVFATGVVACFWQVFSLITSVRWIEEFAGDQAGERSQAPQLLASLASLLGPRGARARLSASSTRSILDSVATRIDEVRDITRYIVNTLIFLGLLGTFYGLATTVPAVVDTIRSLAPQEGEGGVEVLNRLMTGLEAQLGGMGVAFASSLLGLAGSLIVGLLELFAGRGQNRFYRELEEWLSSITRLGLADAEGGGEQGAMAGAVDHLAGQVEGLRAMLAQSGAGRARADEMLGGLADAVGRMAARLEARDGGGDALARIAGGQDRLVEAVERRASGDAAAGEALARIAEGQDRLVEAVERQASGDGIDAESRMRLRSIDVQMLRILEEVSAGRAESMAMLRADIAALAAALGQGRDAGGGERRGGSAGDS